MDAISNAGRTGSVGGLRAKPSPVLSRFEIDCMSPGWEVRRDHAVKVAANLGAELTWRNDCIRIEGRNFVNHLATIADVMAWAIGFEAAFASLDMLYSRVGGTPVASDSKAAA
jgi:hypothetical protein